MLSVDDTKKIVDKMCMEMFGKDFCDNTTSHKSVGGIFV